MYSALNCHPPLHRIPASTAHTNVSSWPTGRFAVQWAMWKGGALPPVTGLTVQIIICCQASYWPFPHKLSSYWSGSLPLRINVLSQFPSPVPVKLNDGKIQ